MYIFWGLALVLLAGGALLCSAVVVPFLRTRSAVADYFLLSANAMHRSIRIQPPGALETKAVQDLGGEKQAARGLALYLRLPRSLAPHRQSAIVLLGFCGPAGTGGLTRLLGDDDPSVRRAAAASLGRAGDKRAVEPLLEALSDEDCSVKIEAARSLAAGGDRRPVPALIAALRDESSVVRTEAAAALGALGDRRAVPALVRALRDRYWTVRRAAVRSLKRTGGPAVLPEITRVAREDPDYHVRKAAAEAIKRLQSAPPRRSPGQ